MALAAAVNALWPFSGKDKQTTPGGPTSPPGGASYHQDDRLAYNDRVAALRDVEYPQLKQTLYLDHAGTTLPSKSLVDEFSRAMLENLISNPHSAAATSSQFSSRKVDDIRLRVLRFFNASPDEFDLVFTANATAAIKLVGECLRDAAEEEGRDWWYGYHKDAHTSLVGLRELLSRTTRARCFASDAEVETFLNTERSDVNSQHRQNGCLNLFAYPAQSNMDGRRLPSSWIESARKAGIYTLLDAAALASTSPLDLGDAERAPDFTALSVYKIFGFPDLGALIVRKQARNVLEKRRYFGGGTVEMVTCLKEQWHVRKQASLHDQLEDGTLPVHSIVALDCALNVHAKLYGTMQQVSMHTSYLADRLYTGLQGLRHGNNRPVCRLYGARTEDSHGPTLAFNISSSKSEWESTFEVEKLATVKNIQLRTGGVCNPGGIASALDLSPWDMQNNFSAGQRCGGEQDIHGGKPTGVIRVSLGASSTLADVDAFVAFMKEFFVQTEAVNVLDAPSLISSYNSFHVETLTVYPIKSCAGWNIPGDTAWPLRSEGLAWDREWCLVHAGTRAALSQKRHTRMALIRPRLDFEAGLLRVSFDGPLPPNVAAEVAVPLSADPAAFAETVSSCNSSVCGDTVTMRTYASESVNNFFSAILDTPCLLARFPPSGSGPSRRHAKAHLAHTSRLLRPLLFSNESPILIISRSSLNRLNETIKTSSPAGRAASASVFRANIVIAEDWSGFEQPFIEDQWKSIRIYSKEVCDRGPTHLDVLGPCRRCQMVCTDQTTGEKDVSGEPFTSLSKTRRKDGKVWFGIHSALEGNETLIQVGDGLEAT